MMEVVPAVYHGCKITQQAGCIVYNLRQGNLNGMRAEVWKTNFEESNFIYYKKR